MMKLFDEMPVIGRGEVVLRPLKPSDAKDLQAFAADDRIYKYLPTYLAERKFSDAGEAIDYINGPLFVQKESLILGVFDDGKFAGLAEFYSYKEKMRKVSIGIRLSYERWGKGLAGWVVALMVDYLHSHTNIEIITASTMSENIPVKKVLSKNGFTMTAGGVSEDWGYKKPTLADKWFR
ncbi:MAG: GNAT family N-acetyltransferase [Clostridiales bacterium]|nr:GNAT family N-acetyltransferase [Clostridiales bacterium]